MVEYIQTIRKKAVQAQGQIFQLKNQLKKSTEDYEDRLNKIFNSMIETLDTIEDAEGPQSPSAIMLLRLLEEIGVTRLIAPVNTIPSYCEVVAKKSAPSLPNGSVFRILKHGYRQADHIIRKTQVVVVDNQAENT
jgi:molecular chaperone GrpE (heat shock protein)